MYFKEGTITTIKNVYLKIIIIPLGHKTNINTSGKTTRKKQHEQQQQWQ